MTAKAPQTPAEVLRAARALIEVPERWTKCAFARDAKGIVVSEDEESAVCFCVLGAIYRHPPSPLTDGARWFLDESLPETFLGVGTFNDHPSTTHADVLALFDRAIALAEGE